MYDTQTTTKWDEQALAKYTTMISKIPIFHRDIAKRVVDKKAVLNAQERKADKVGEADIVGAFFSEVPKAFYSLMIRLLDEVGFDHRDYDKG